MPLNPRLKENGGDRDPEIDKLRVVPVQCTEAERDDFVAQGANFTGELMTCSDSRRVYRGNSFIGPVISHGDVADEAEMLGLNAARTRKCRVGDWCYRSDLGGAKWVCVSEYGLTLGQWRADPMVLPTGGQYFPVSIGDVENPGLIFLAGSPVFIFA